MPVGKEVAGNERDIPKRWLPWRREDGTVVTATWEQVEAIWRAVRIVEDVRRSEGHESLFDENVNPYAELYKSRLLGRIVIHGLPPTKSRPPIAVAGPAWWLLPGGDPWEGWNG